jgi:hypothetical protein
MRVKLGASRQRPGCMLVLASGKAIMSKFYAVLRGMPSPTKAMAMTQLSIQTKEFAKVLNSLRVDGSLSDVTDISGRDHLTGESIAGESLELPSGKFCELDLSMELDDQEVDYSIQKAAFIKIIPVGRAQMYQAWYRLEVHSTVVELGFTKRIGMAIGATDTKVLDGSTVTFEPGVRADEILYRLKAGPESQIKVAAATLHADEAARTKNNEDLASILDAAMERHAETLAAKLSEHQDLRRELEALMIQVANKAAGSGN